MTTKSFKSISPEELEAAIASAISAITNTKTEVSIGQWKETSNGADGFIGQERFEVQLSFVSEKRSPVRGSLKDED
jgi:hypothetical protein